MLVVVVVVLLLLLRRLLPTTTTTTTTTAATAATAAAAAASLGPTGVPVPGGPAGPSPGVRGGHCPPGNRFPGVVGRLPRCVIPCCVHLYVCMAQYSCSSVLELGVWRVRGRPVKSVP